MALTIRNVLGRRVDVKVGADVASGAFAVRNLISGIPLLNVLNGATVTFVVEGLVAITFGGQGTLAQGSFLYWDRSNSALSLGAGALDLPVGQIVDIIDSANKVCLVRLNPAYPSAAATRGQ